MVPVSSGSSATVSVKVRMSSGVDGMLYNGQYPSLYVATNYGGGNINQDTLLATATAASSGAFETITGTSPVVQDDCILSFYVTAGGTGYSTGWVNIDTFSSTTTNDSQGLKYWRDGLPVVYSNNLTGGGSGTAAYTYWG